MNNPIEQLSIADPDLAKMVQTGLMGKKELPAGDIPAFIVDDIIWALSQEISFGWTVATGYVDLAGVVDENWLKKYQGLVRKAGKSGPTLGKIMATSLVPIILHKDQVLLDHFLKTTQTMLAKGTYTLTTPLGSLSNILNSGDRKAGRAFLALMQVTFIQDLSYNQSRVLSNILPKAVDALSSKKRTWQIRELSRIIQTDFRLAEPFLDSLKKGLDLLDQKALVLFVSKGLEKFRHNRKLGKKFLALESKLGLDTFQSLQLAVSLAQVRQRLGRYLQARTGLSLAIRPLSSLSKAVFKAGTSSPTVVSDGKFIYLPDEMGIYPTKEENITLYKMFVRLEIGYYEFHTYDFDLSRAVERLGHNNMLSLGFSDDDFPGSNRDISDLERFFNLFPDPKLASDLFTIFEHGRIRSLFTKYYPGIIKQAFPILQKEAQRLLQEKNAIDPLFWLYMSIALDSVAEKPAGLKIQTESYLYDLPRAFEDKIKMDPFVETCAEFVFFSYKDMENLIHNMAGGSRTDFGLQTPFNRRLRPDLFFLCFQKYEVMAKKLKQQLKKKGIKVYQSDLTRHLREQEGSIEEEDIKTIILMAQDQEKTEKEDKQKNSIDLSFLDLEEILEKKETDRPESMDSPYPVFRYHEWDSHFGDYLQDHVLIHEKNVPGQAGDFFLQTLKHHKGLVKKIRYSFELLKPQNLTILRKWLEGDEFDYRALLDYAIDKKAGIMPSDRLYIKRIKKERDVSVLLLVDLSRSTANTVPGADRTVLDIEKEAIILLCEALGVVGDSFSIAGFSGTGRLGVSYYCIKNFEESMDETIQQRINAMSPQRRTRMGAAIRHATYHLEKKSAKTRLLLVLGDGFPSDTGYSQEYAIEDTHRALLEAKSKNIHAHNITVNTAADVGLDNLYGKIHHNVISDVHELPDKLLRIYGSLTR